MNKCIFFIVTVALLLGGGNWVNAQTTSQEQPGDESTSSHVAGLALGFEITDFQSDYGLGLNFTTPYFFKKTMAVRLHGGVAWIEGIAADDNEPDYYWMHYFPVRLGMVFSVGMGNGMSRLYSEAGGLVYLGATDVASDMVIGGYGILGFEFLPAAKAPVAYFFQAGGMGSSGNATELLGSPSFGNGFVMEVGIRWYPQ